jgi:ribosomal-protein-alanine N-acetyltransferase
MIVTPRLELVPATARLLLAALASDAALAVELGAVVPQTWPPEFLDRSALEFTLGKVNADPASAPWWMSFVVLRAGVSPRTLIGTAGFKGPPDSGDSVEIGYGIVSQFHRRGFATEAALALIARTREEPQVTCVTAETLPELAASIGVLRRCGFTLVGPAAEPGVIRYALRLDRTPSAIEP